MKRSPQSDGAVVRDDCDSCIQAMLEPASLNTEEASCQTDCKFFNIFEGVFHSSSIISSIAEKIWSSFHSQIIGLLTCGRT